MVLFDTKLLTILWFKNSPRRLFHYEKWRMADAWKVDVWKLTLLIAAPHEEQRR